MFLNFIKKLFIGGEWGIAFKKKNDNLYSVVRLPKGLWAADPMLFERDGTHYLFAEIYETSKKKAGIGYFEFIDGLPVYKGIVINNDYHMSYPCVFEKNGAIYMVPESSANNTLELYEATNFPTEWKKTKVLLDNCQLVDSTVFSQDGNLFLLSYRKNKNDWSLICFLLDLKEKELIKKSEVLYKQNVGRPAGNLIRKEGYFLRPAQDCSRKYGEKILFYKINSLEPLNEEVFSQIGINDIRISRDSKRVHTYGQDSVYEVVDFFVERFELFHAIDIYKRSHYKKDHKK